MPTLASTRVMGGLADLVQDHVRTDAGWVYGSWIFVLRSICQG
jgi:hypothetical protein